MKKYFVIHSSDPYLLARLCIELQMEGASVCPITLEFKYFDPFNDSDFRYLKIRRCEIEFHTHECVGNPVRLHLLEKNYEWVLNQIVKQ